MSCYDICMKLKIFSFSCTILHVVLILGGISLLVCYGMLFIVKKDLDIQYSTISIKLDMLPIERRSESLLLSNELTCYAMLFNTA